MENTLSMTEYTDKLIFDNLYNEKEAESSAFSLESYIRSAAQTMIQVALELEAEEIFQRRIR